MSKDISDNEALEIIKAIISISNKFNNDKKIQKEITKLLSSYYKNLEEIPPRRINKFDPYLEDRKPELLTISVIDDDQYVRDAIHTVIEKIGKEALLLLPTDKYEFLYGDDDEGCIYARKK